MERLGQGASQAEGTAWGRTQGRGGDLRGACWRSANSFCPVSTECVWAGAGREQIEEPVSGRWKRASVPCPSISMGLRRRELGAVGVSAGRRPRGSCRSWISKTPTAFPEATGGRAGGGICEPESSLGGDCNYLARDRGPELASGGRKRRGTHQPCFGHHL